MWPNYNKPKIQYYKSRLQNHVFGETKQNPKMERKKNREKNTMLQGIEVGSFPTTNIVYNTKIISFHIIA